MSVYREFVMGEFSNVMYWLEILSILGIIYSFDARDQQKSFTGQHLASTDDIMSEGETELT